MRKNVILYSIIGLAIIGLTFQLIKNPLGIFKWLFFMLIFAVIIFTVVRFFIKRSNPRSTSEMKKYKQAVKQSKQRYQHKQPSNKRPQKNSPRTRRRKRATHLRVIDGNKSKSKDNKDEATF